jgi:hypothetical protein
MPRQTQQQTGPSRADLSDTLDSIADLAKEALDPELTREEVVQKVKEIADLASGETDEEDEDDQTGDGGSDDDERER